MLDPLEAPLFDTRRKPSFINCNRESEAALCPPGYDMSTFIRRYSRYLNEKAMSYRLVAVDFTKMKRG